MKIEFEWETFKEDDTSWNALFVKINNGRWLMAKPKFGTENIREIENIILSDPERWS